MLCTFVCVSFSLFLFLSHCLARLTWNWPSFCLIFLKAEITGMHHQADLCLLKKPTLSVLSLNQILLCGHEKIVEYWYCS
jgi:hypothetical protein